MAYLLYGVEVWVVEVAKEPEHTRAQHLPEEQDEGGEVEDVHHADQPPDEDEGAWREVEALVTLLQSGVKHTLKATKQSFTLGMFRAEMRKQEPAGDTDKSAVEVI